MGGSEYTQQELTDVRLPNVRETLWINPFSTHSRLLQLPLQAMESHAYKDCKKHYWEKLHLFFSLSETNFTVNSLSHHNTHAFVMDDLHFH